MSRKANSGWLFGSETRTVTVGTEGPINDVFPIIEGSTLREGELEALAGERADYFIERLLVWGVGFYNTNFPLTRSNSVAMLRVGTADREHQSLMVDNFLMTVDNTELWSRVLFDHFLGVYDNPVWAFDGAALAVDDGVVGTQVKTIHQQVGPSHFALDIQQRFSLQREEDNLYVAFGPEEQYFASGDIYTLSFVWKALVKEYRK